MGPLAEAGRTGHTSWAPRGFVPPGTLANTLVLSTLILTAVGYSSQATMCVWCAPVPNCLLIWILLFPQPLLWRWHEAPETCIPDPYVHHSRCLFGGPTPSFHTSLSMGGVHHHAKWWVGRKGHTIRLKSDCLAQGSIAECSWLIVWRIYTLMEDF